MFRLALILLLLSTASLLPATPTLEEEASADLDLQDLVDESAIRTGDLVFRRGRSWLSRAVIEADPASSFSHVGLAVVEDGDIVVIHATPGDRTTPAGVVAESLSSYLSPEAAQAVAVLRVDDEAAARAAAETAKDWVLRAVPFDGAFEASYDIGSDTEDEALYCTELVWKAYLRAGLDLLDGELDRLAVPLGPDHYVLPSSLLASSHVTHVPEAQLHGRDP